MVDKTQVDIYAATGTITNLSDTCNSREDAYEARLVGLERVDAEDGSKGTQATYQRIPFSEIYIKKQLFFVDVASPTPQPPATEPVFDNADVYLDDSEAQVAVYRQQ